jgi:hypothetical protein
VSVAEFGEILYSLFRNFSLKKIERWTLDSVYKAER